MSKNNNVDVYDVVVKNHAWNDVDAIGIRKFMMYKLLVILPEIENKLLHGRIKDKETEKIRIEYFKQYINISNCINNFTKDASYYVEKDVLKEFLDVDVSDDFDFVENPE